MIYNTFICEHTSLHALCYRHAINVTPNLIHLLSYLLILHKHKLVPVLETSITEKFYKS